MICNKCGNNIEPGSSVCNICGNNIDNSSNNKPFKTSGNKNSWGPKILFVIVIIGIIIAIILSVKNLLSNNENKISNENTNLEKETTTKKDATFEPLPPVTDKSKYISYQGFDMYIPDGFTTNVSSGSLMYTNTSKNQVLTVQLSYLSFEEIDDYLDNSIDELSEFGYKKTKPKTSSVYKNIRYSIIYGEMNGTNVATGCMDFIPGYIIGFSYRSDLSSESSYLEVLYQIITNSNKDN